MQEIISKLTNSDILFIIISTIIILILTIGALFKSLFPAAYNTINKSYNKNEFNFDVALGMVVSVILIFVFDIFSDDSFITFLPPICIGFILLALLYLVFIGSTDILSSNKKLHFLFEFSVHLGYTLILIVLSLALTEKPKFNIVELSLALGLGVILLYGTPFLNTKYNK